MKINKYFFVLLIFSTSVYSIDYSEQLLQKIYDYRGNRIYLLSYPRSGNTWSRYCLEFLTKRATFFRFGQDDRRNRPLAWVAKFDLDYKKGPIEKAHKVSEVGYCCPSNSELGYDTQINKDTDKLILIIRNPKEAITRHEAKEITVPLLVGSPKIDEFSSRTYFYDIELYANWNPEKRLLIYYEDLINDPRENLTKMLNFLDEPLTHLDQFLRDYQRHQKIAVTLYQESASKGSDLLFHSKKILPAYRKQIDRWIEELYPFEWHTYLKHRYSEEILDYSI